MWAQPLVGGGPPACVRVSRAPSGLLPKQVKARVDARNALETYCYNMKQTIEDKLGDKLDEDDKDKVGYPWPDICYDAVHTLQ